MKKLVSMILALVLCLVACTSLAATADQFGLWDDKSGVPEVYTGREKPLTLTFGQLGSGRENDYMMHYYNRFNEVVTELTGGSIRLDLDGRNAYKGDQPVDLTAKEFDVIEFLMRNPGRVYSRENLLDTIWAYEYRSDMRTVDVHIRRLREKLEENPAEPKHIMTKWGVGYYFKK